MTKEELRARAKEIGFSSLGVASPDAEVHIEFYRRWLAKGYGAEMNYLATSAELKPSPTFLLPEAKSVIMVTLDYNQPTTSCPDSPKIARYALGRDYHKIIRKKLKMLAAELGGANRICVDSAPLLERDFANLAGLGWFGKNTCLIDSRRGSWFLIGALLSSETFEPDSPALGGCGTCKKCVDACPTGAIVFEEDRWQVDARKCISYLTIEHKGPLPSEYKPRLAGWTFGCDVCQEVCPFNAPRDSQPVRGAFATDPDLLRTRDWPNLSHLSQISDEDWDELTRGSPVRRAGPTGLRRNANANLEENR
jgi:epoxyqueuosine reductase